MNIESIKVWVVAVCTEDIVKVPGFVAKLSEKGLSGKGLIKH